MGKIPVFKPLLEQEEMAASAQALELGWLGMGAFVGQFETALKHFTQASDRHVVAVSTGHAALHLGLLVAGAGPGDEVITPSFNNIADFQAILATGAAPVFCDTDNDTLCLDLQKAEELVSPRTKAIIAMDYDCLLCDHDQVADFAARHLQRLHEPRQQLGGRLARPEMDWSHYFVEFYGAVAWSQNLGVNMDCELAAWKTTLAEQPLELQRRVRETLASTEGPEWCRGIDAAFKNLRRCTGLLALEEALRTQSRKMLGRKMASRFANILEYVEWDDGLGGRPRN